LKNQTSNLADQATGLAEWMGGIWAVEKAAASYAPPWLKNKISFGSRYLGHGIFGALAIPQTAIAGMYALAGDASNAQRMANGALHNWGGVLAAEATRRFSTFTPAIRGLSTQAGRRGFFQALEKAAFRGGMRGANVGAETAPVVDAGIAVAGAEGTTEAVMVGVPTVAATPETLGAATAPVALGAQAIATPVEVAEAPVAAEAGASLGASPIGRAVNGTVGFVLGASAETVVFMGTYLATGKIVDATVPAKSKGAPKTAPASKKLPSPRQGL
jgi:hypothetical protein